MNAPDSDSRHCAKDVRFVDERLCVDFEDGRTISVPVEVYPRLA